MRRSCPRVPSHVAFFLSYTVLPRMKSWTSRIAILLFVWGVAFLATLFYWEMANENRQNQRPVEYESTFTTGK